MEIGKDPQHDERNFNRDFNMIFDVKITGNIGFKFFKFIVFVGK